MSDKIKCGDCTHCGCCKLFSQIKELSSMPSFTRNNMGRCDWFTDQSKVSYKKN